MKLLWTKSNNPVDVIIKAVTGEDCAHFAILFDVKDTGVIFESNLLGAHPAFFKTWVKNRTVIHEKEVPLTLEQENAVWDKWVEHFDGQPYDFAGVIYLGLMVLRERLFKIPRPEHNPWASKTAYFCDEVYQLVSGLPGFPAISCCSNGMDTPHDVWEKVK